MELLTKTLFLCLALTLTAADPVPAPDAVAEADDGLPHRCDDVEFDAITPDEKGIMFFFKGPHLWRGFDGDAQLSNESFAELDDLHHIGHVDAAFRMHNEDNVGEHDHDHIYFFLDDQVFSYYNHTLEANYPKAIADDFPGVPGHLDAAAECPKGECTADSVLFFKGHDVFVYDLTTKTVKTKTWDHLPNCTSAIRWQEHYYCFHGHNFTRFHPVTGEVNPGYPKDARKYFMKCPGHTHGDHSKIPKCSEMKLDAITTDDDGKSYMFAGALYMRLDTERDGLHSFSITRQWKEVQTGVDAAFSYDHKIYLIKDDNVFIYKGAAPYTLVEGYPKTLKEELGVEGHVDAAFVCPAENTVHIIQGTNLVDVDLSATPRAITKTTPLPIADIDAGSCDSHGVNVYKGHHFYHYESATTLAMSKIAPMPQDITHAMMACQE